MQVITDSTIKTYKGFKFQKLYDEKHCTQVIDRIAAQINQFYRQFQQDENKSDKPFQIVAVCLLKGAFMFYADLCKRLNMKIICEFVKLSSYNGEESSGQLKIQSSFNPQNFKNKHVLIIEDMADTGFTLEVFSKMIEEVEPKSLKTAVLVNRPDKPKKINIDWVGMECSAFIIGYGLDYDQFGRTFPAIYQKIQ